MRLFPKLRLSSGLLRLASHFVDYEAEALPPDGRIIEYGFVTYKLSGVSRGKVLDVGCTARHNYILPTLALSGWEVWGIDVREFKFKHPNFHFVLGDISHTSFPDDFFDCVYVISTLEHIGLSGYYGVTEADPEGDAKAVREISRVLGTGGKLLATVPYARRQFIRPGARVYDKHGLQKLFSDYELKEKTLYIQDSDGFWIPITEETIQERGKEGIALLELQK